MTTHEASEVIFGLKIEVVRMYAYVGLAGLHNGVITFL